MKSKVMRNEEETLLPSSLFEEENNSDNESDSSINFNKNLSLFNEDRVDHYPNKVIIININFTYYKYRKKRRKT